jgi:hypothetical protein
VRKKRFLIEYMDEESVKEGENLPNEEVMVLSFFLESTNLSEEIAEIVEVNGRLYFLETDFRE